MKNRTSNGKRNILIIMGILLVLFLAGFSYRTVQKTVIHTEQANLKSIVSVSAHSFQKTLESKEDLIYVTFSDDLHSEDDIMNKLALLGAIGQYIPEGDVDTLPNKLGDQCRLASSHPDQVITGPIITNEDQSCSLYMTKAVHFSEKSIGYVQIIWNMNELLEDEQALSMLQLSHEGYYLIKDINGNTLLPSDTKSELAISLRDNSDCQVEWCYETKNGATNQYRKLVAYESVNIGSETLYLCIIEDYDQIVQPLEYIALCFFALAVVLIIFVALFIKSMMEQKKQEGHLLSELKYEKELNEANEALRHQEVLMQKYNHSKTLESLTNSIAHEFNNLMTPILLYTDLLSENETILKEASGEVFELKSSAERCGELARQLLEYSRLGKAEKVMTVYNATFAVQNSIKVIHNLIPDNITIKTIVCKSAYYVCGQAGSINQILLNFTNNAIDAMKEHGGTLSIQFGLSTSDDQTVRLVVSDTGSGIPKDVLLHIFDPFFTTKNTGESNDAGNGIGLVVVRTLVQEHGGQIRVKSKVGEGTTFIVDLPIADPPKESESPEVP